ncbi:MAG: tRNA pseudouridine(38-40) synthase TruA [Capsulimonadaceae bacterium]|nr:tRNA pseudouridine(38-40) synthase TruA [Capsulimonadaceae bacterium]
MDAPAGEERTPREAGARRIKLILEYDGTGYAGFQRQAKGERTIQGTLEEALASIAGHPVGVVAAGRTDCGVHARGQVVHFDLRGRIPSNRIAIAANSALPRDIAVRTAEEVGPGFHARFSASQRTYVYLIWNDGQRSALWGRFATWERYALDLDAMRDAAGLLTGIRDFAPFANAGGDPGSTTVRDLRRLRVRQLGRGPLIAIEATANGFLRSMVRNIVAVLIAAGKHEVSGVDVAAIAGAARRDLNRCETAKPEGLCLLRVDYGLPTERAGKNA